MRLTPLSLAVLRERMARIRSSVARIANWNWLSNIVMLSLRSAICLGGFCKSLGED